MTGLGFVSKLYPGSRRRKGTSVRKSTRPRLELESLEERTSFPETACRPI
jgi:hypothetical protein